MIGLMNEHNALMFTVSRDRFLNHQGLPGYLSGEKGFMLSNATLKCKKSKHRQQLGSDC